MALIAAMEEAQNDNLGADNLEQAAEQAAVVGEDRAEVADQAADVETDIIDVVDATSDAEELEDIAEVAQDAVESGEGLSEQAAEVATIAIERIHQRLGFRGKQRIVAATESFGHANTRLHSTKLVVEGISDTLKSIWEAIKSMAQRVWDKISQFFRKITGSAKSLRDHLSNLAKRADELDSSAKPKEKELSGSIAKKISIDGKASAATYSKLVANALKLAKNCNGIAATTTELSASVLKISNSLTESGISEATVKAFAESAGNSYKKVDALADIGDTIAKSDVNSKTKVKKYKKGSITTQHFGPFVNATVLTVTTEDDGEKGQSVTIGFDSLSDKKIADKAEALDRSSVSKVISEAISVADEAENLAKVEKEVKKIVDEAQKAADNMIKSISKIVDSKGDGSARSSMSKARDTISTVFSLLNQLGQRIPATVLATAFAGADYASASLANLRKE